MQLQLMEARTDPHREEDRVTTTDPTSFRVGTNRDIVHDAFDVLARLNGSFDQIEHRIGAGHRAIPIALNGLDVAQVHQHAISDSVGASIRINDLTKQGFMVAHNKGPLGPYERLGHIARLSPTADWQFRHTVDSQAVDEHRGGVLQDQRGGRE